jgi:hypothetical protein
MVGVCRSWGPAAFYQYQKPPPWLVVEILQVNPHLEQWLATLKVGDETQLIKVKDVAAVHVI